tara:strand:- start:16663 stop:17886 length:1224 start_codon:yes stop_codon:yes gene_type:complete
VKTLLLLFPYKFTEFYYYKFEFFYLNKKNYEVIIHDLSDIIANPRYIKSTKTKADKRTKKFSSLMSWIRAFNKIKRKKNVLVYDMVGDAKFRVFIIKLILKLSNLPVLEYKVAEIGEWKNRKRNKKFFIEAISEQQLNLKFYIYRIKEIFYSRLIKLIKFKKTYLLVNKKLNGFYNSKKIDLINHHSYDYSTSLIEKKKISVKKNRKRYIVYLDKPRPYFGGDTLLDGMRLPKNDIDKWYNELNSLFGYLEKLFNAKVLIIPHNKYKIPKLKKKNLNPYFNNRTSDNSYNACEKHIPGCLFIIADTSTAVSYGIINYKPIQYIYSSNYIYLKKHIKNLILQSRLTGMNLINIASIDKKKIIRNLSVDKKKYDQYKFKYLTYKNPKSIKFNHQIIKEIMNGLVEKKGL